MNYTARCSGPAHALLGITVQSWPLRFSIIVLVYIADHFLLISVSLHNYPGGKCTLFTFKIWGNSWVKWLTQGHTDWERQSQDANQEAGLTPRSKSQMPLDCCNHYTAHIWALRTHRLDAGTAFISKHSLRMWLSTWVGRCWYFYLHLVILHSRQVPSKISDFSCKLVGSDLGSKNDYNYF